MFWWKISDTVINDKNLVTIYLVKFKFSCWCFFPVITIFSEQWLERRAESEKGECWLPLHSVLCALGWSFPFHGVLVECVLLCGFLAGSHPSSNRVLISFESFGGVSMEAPLAQSWQEPYARSGRLCLLELWLTEDAWLACSTRARERWLLTSCCCGFATSSLFPQWFLTFYGCPIFFQRNHLCLI